MEIASPMNRCNGRVRNGTVPFVRELLHERVGPGEQILDDPLVVFHRRALRDGQCDDRLARRGHAIYVQCAVDDSGLEA